MLQAFIVSSFQEQDSNERQRMSTYTLFLSLYFQKYFSKSAIALRIHILFEFKLFFT